MKVAINLMVNQLLGASSEREEDEMARWFSDFVDGCLSLPINFPGFAYHTAMKVKKKSTNISQETISILITLNSRVCSHTCFLSFLLQLRNLIEHT